MSQGIADHQEHVRLHREYVSAYEKLLNALKVPQCLHPETLKATLAFIDSTGILITKYLATVRELKDEELLRAQANLTRTRLN